MRRIAWLTALFLMSMAVGAATGQTTAVSAVVTDSDGFIWTTARVTVAFVPNPSFPNLNQYTLNGQNLATYQPYNSLLNQSVISNPTTGAFAFTLLDNTRIQPQGSSWYFVIQSNTSAPASTYNPVQISGTTQNLTTFLSTFSTVPRFSAVNIAGTFGYGDVEITTVPNPGGLYYNTTTLSTRQWNGTVWTNLSSGSVSGVSQLVAGTNISLSPTNGLGVVTVTASGSGGSGSFNLNIAEMGALSSGANPPLTHTNHYVMPLAQSTSQINTLLASIGQGALVFPNGDSVYNSFGNRWYQAHITHEGVMFWTYKINEDDYGIIADGRTIQMSFSSTSKTFTISSDIMRSYDIGKSVWLYNNTTQTTFQSQIQTIPDSAHFTVASFPPWTGSGSFWVGTDNTTNLQQMITDLRPGGGQGPVGPGSGTYITPAGVTLSAGATLSHTIDPQGTSLQGAGVISELVFPGGEDAFATPDAFTNGGEQQIATHLNDFAVILSGGIDATQAWTKINDSGTISVTALYRPGYFRTKDSNNPFAPEWCIGSGPNGSGCSLGVATTNGTTVICSTDGTAPTIGQQIMFPYVSGGLIETTVSSTAGSCGSGTPFTLGASIPTGTNQEYWLGTNFQHTAVDFPASRTYPFALTAANLLIATPASEDGLAPYGLIQIGNEQCTYYNINMASGVNTYTITGCTGTAVDHPSNSYIAPLNQFNPSMPWPVPTTAGGNQTTPANASYYPGHNIGNCAWAFPQSDGRNNAAASWSQAHIENILIQQNEFPAYNNTCAFYFVGYPYATHFNDIRIINTEYGPIQSVPAKNNHNWTAFQSTSDGTTWTGITIHTGYIFDFMAANQNNFSNFDTYSQLGNSSGGSVGCGGGFFFTYGWDDETGGLIDFVSSSETHNLYIEPESGTHCQQEALNEFDGLGVTYTDIHQGAGGYVYIGGSDQHFISGNFNNIGLGGGGGVPPVVNYGQRNSILYTANVGTPLRCNNFNPPAFSCGFINWGKDFYGLVPEGGGANALMNPAYGNTRAIVDGQNNDMFNIGNVGSDFFPNSSGGLITPSEYNFGLDPFPVSRPWVFDSTATVTQSNVACNVGTNITTTRYCSPYRFDGGEGIWIGPGGRLGAGKYIVYWSMKSGLSTNTAYWGIGVGCTPGTITTIAGPFPAPVTNAYPSTSAGVAQAVVDLTPYANCGLALENYGATTADTIYTQFVDFAPLPDNFNVQQLTIQGTGQPTLNLGTNGGETWQTGAPSTGCGSTYANGYIWHNLAGTTASTNHEYVCNASTTTWVNVF